MTNNKSILIKSIYYMLSYAFSSLDGFTFEDAGKEAFENLHNLFAALLSKGIGRQLKRGCTANTQAALRIQPLCAADWT